MCHEPRNVTADLGDPFLSWLPFDNNALSEDIALSVYTGTPSYRYTLLIRMRIYVTAVGVALVRVRTNIVWRASPPTREEGAGPPD